MQTLTNVITLCHVTLLLTPTAHAQFPDLLWACPALGCSARGTYALPTPAPTAAYAHAHARQTTTNAFTKVSNDDSENGKIIDRVPPQGNRPKAELPMLADQPSVQWTWEEADYNPRFLRVLFMFVKIYLPFLNKTIV